MDAGVVGKYCGVCTVDRLLSLGSAPVVQYGELVS